MQIKLPQVFQVSVALPASKPKHFEMLFLPVLLPLSYASVKLLERDVFRARAAESVVLLMYLNCSTAFFFLI